MFVRIHALKKIFDKNSSKSKAEVNINISEEKITEVY